MPNYPRNSSGGGQPVGVRAKLAAWCVSPALLLTTISGCAGRQSALAPAGRGAEQLANLFWVMAIGAAIIWLIVVGLGVTSLFRPHTGSARKAGFYIIGGGVLFPTIILAGLLSYGLTILPQQVSSAPEGSLRVAVAGHRWWWRVAYELDGETVELANELHLPVDEPVGFDLSSADVIHSFWIPPLGGKIDMVPGRLTHLTLHPTRAGSFRGACAEYCGASHALMCFEVVVEERAAFDDWLRRQAEQAAEPATPLARRGAELFQASGCGACHTIRGTAAAGRVGPDLTHVASRASLAAGTLPNDRESLQRWIARPKEIKPEAEMPRFDVLPREDLQALAAYLDSLE